MQQLGSACRLCQETKEIADRDPATKLLKHTSILDALKADLPTIPASTVQASSRAMAHHDDAFVASAASIVPASSTAVRGMHMVPVVSMSEGSERGSENHSDFEAPIDEEGGASDDASVVPSEGRTVSWEELGIRPAANARGFVTGLAQLDAFTLTTIFERRAHVRVVMRAVLSSAFRAACEEIVNAFIAGDITRQERAWKLLLFLTRMLLCRPRRGLVPRKELEQRLAFFIEGNWQELVSCSIRMADQSSQRLVRRGRHNSDVEARAVRAAK